MTLRILIACAVLAFWMCPPVAPLAAADRTQSGTGRVTGKVTLTSVTSSRSPATAYDQRSVGPRAIALPELRNVVIFVADIPVPVDLPAMKASVTQKDEQFVPHLVAVTAGSAVSFPNLDPFFHNVFSLSRGATFDLGRFPPGASRARVFKQPGMVKVFCHIHSQMSAVIRVFEHPWFTIPDDQGTFTLDDVPPGELTLAAWHERIGEQRDRVTIRPGQTTEVAFTLPVLEPTR